jgi:hypothetical protein
MVRKGATELAQARRKIAELECKVPKGALAQFASLVRALLEDLVG